MKYEKDHQGCMRGILHLFNVHQRLQMRKMLWDKRHGVERHAAGGIRIPSAKPNIPGTVKGHNNMDIEPNFLGEDKINSSTKASGKACMRELIAEEMSKKQGQTQRVPDFSSRLMRTLSIHHLECNDYVRPEDMTSKSDTPRAIFHPHDTSYSASSEHMPLLPKVPYEANYSIPCEVCGNINTTGHNQLDELGNIFVKEVHHKEELNEIESGFLGKKSADNELRKDVAYCRSQNVLDALVSFNTNREIFLKILQEPNSVALSKSSSFPTPGFSDSAARRSKLRHKRKETECFAMQEGKFQAGKSSSIPNTIGSKDTGSWALSLIVDDKVGGSKPEQKSHITGSEGNYEFSLESKDGLKDTTDDGNARSHFKSIKHRIKDVIKESRKEGHRISRDGILHKIPYGFEASQDLKAERPGPWEGRESPRSQSDMIFSTNNKHAHHNIRRSRSLTESLYRYSQLFEFTLGKDSRRHTNEKPELAHEAGGSQVRDPPKMLGRIFSLPEFQSYFPGNDDQTTISSDIFYSRASSMDLAESNSDFNFNGLDEQKSVSSLVNTEGHTQLDTGMTNARLDEQKSVSSLVNTEGHTQLDTGMENASLDEQKPVSSLVNTEGHTQLDTGMANASLDEQKPVSSLVNTEGHTQLDTGMANASLEHALEYNATGAIDGDQCVPDIEGDGIEMHDAQANSTDEHCRRTSLHEQEIEPDMDHSDKPGTPSPISVLNSYFQEDLISSAKFSASEGSELTPRNIPLELDSLVDPEDQSATDATNLVETVGADNGEVEILRKNAGIDAPHVQVDWKNEPDFNYVMNILKKSGFGSDEFLGTWYSSNQPVDPSLFEDMECSLYEDEISRYGSDINLDHLLLFDLINEALFKIYERSSALCPWIQCSDSQIRPTPMGHHILKEVWANISWHLNSQPQLNPTLDYVVERDFTKNDGWMNLQTDRECVGLELESLIFDDLLDGAVLEFFISCSHPGDLS